MRAIFIFLDGVGLGADDPEINPFALSLMPNLEMILGGHKLLADGYLQSNETDYFLVENEHASLIALDACLGVNGVPQSATGQASLLTGINVPSLLGFHEGPKPTPPIRKILENGTLLSELVKLGKTAALVNAFPYRYFENIAAGYRIPGVIALSSQQAGFSLKTTKDLYDGDAISADFTAEGWRSRLGFSDTPLLNHIQAGERLSKLAGKIDLAIFEYWLTDIAGHHQDMQSASGLLTTLDDVIGSLVQSWDLSSGIILITSDHGNLEDLSTRHHTRNPVPLLVIGSTDQRRKFFDLMIDSRSSKDMLDLTDFAPAILEYLAKSE